MAFTEQGVAMLSGVLNSKRAIAVNIRIIRVFAKMRMLLNNQKEILIILEALEKKDIALTNCRRTPHAAHRFITFRL